MEFTDLPSIDWNLGIRLAGNQRALAEEMLSLLLHDLSEVKERIKKLYHQQNYGKMRQEIHKLRGAASYCGVPRLRSILEQLEAGIKTSTIDSIPPLLDLFDTEVNLLLELHITEITR